MKKPEEIQSSHYYSDLNLQGDQVVEPKDRPFRVVHGWSDVIANQLVRRSHEKTTAVHYPRDHDERFVDLKSANLWWSKNGLSTEIYTLQLRQAKRIKIAAAVWFTLTRESSFADVTFNLRTYEPLRDLDPKVGEGLGRVALADYELHYYDGDFEATVEEGDADREILANLGFAPVKSDEPALMLRFGVASRAAKAAGRNPTSFDDN